MNAGSGLSAQADPVRAGIEAARQATAALSGCDLALVFASGAPAAQPALLTTAVQEITGAGVVMGCSGAGVLTEAGELEGDGVAVLAIEGITVRTAQRAGLATPQTISLALADLDLSDRGTVIALFDAMTFPATSAAAAFQRQIPLSVPILGGGALGLTGEPWVIAGPPDSPALTDALAAAWLPDVQCRWGLCHACLPLTEPLPITEAEGGVILTLGGRRAIDVVREAVRAPMMADLEHMATRIFLGIATPGQAPLIRPLLGLDPHGGAIAVGGLPAQIGQELTVMVRDADHARTALSTMLAEQAAGEPPAFGLFIKGAGRGQELYGELAGIETALVAAALPGVPFAGFLSGCELAPADPGGALHLYGGLLGLFA
ncbi:MAG: small ligand-binding sensory domain FIST [Myxococcota bacterium]|jgi:small ligand-binding sensory domain FIST